MVNLELGSDSQIDHLVDKFIVYVERNCEKNIMKQLTNYITAMS